MYLVLMSACSFISNMHQLQQKGRALYPVFLFVLLLLTFNHSHAEVKYTPYTEQKVVFDFYFDEPEKINAALYWIRSYMNPLTEAPYNQAPEFMDIKVIIHGRELVVLAKNNYKKYQEAVERMKYYVSLGVKFKACAIAMNDFGYNEKDFHDFVEIVPSAMTELVHWQMQGYGLITPKIIFKNSSNEELR